MCKQIQFKKKKCQIVIDIILKYFNILIRITYETSE